ncbi:conserved hypothetical protein [Methanococcus maripaludis C5]|uniref:Uncharacterized protein n=1 Tax=Methanococcus maripaludis (strain C5 / ATCC BAA-1333) TaxID=402880 RepID=A4G0V2_METM5|nr:hypothetical protein [Methanococcus maripaludis]ABO36086.1 conserved hypothetical protein [Methanococcus maripaludis C5]
MNYLIILLFFTIGLFLGFYINSNRIYSTFPIVLVFNVLLYEAYLLHMLNSGLAYTLPLGNMLSYIIINNISVVIITTFGFFMGVILKVLTGTSYGRC